MKRSSCRRIAHHQREPLWTCGRPEIILKVSRSCPQCFCTTVKLSIIRLAGAEKFPSSVTRAENGLTHTSSLQTPLEDTSIPDSPSYQNHGL